MATVVRVVGNEPQPFKPVFVTLKLETEAELNTFAEWMGLVESYQTTSNSEARRIKTQIARAFLNAIK